MKTKLDPTVSAYLLVARGTLVLAGIVAVCAIFRGASWAAPVAAITIVCAVITSALPLAIHLYVRLTASKDRLRAEVFFDRLNNAIRSRKLPDSELLAAFASLGALLECTSAASRAAKLIVGPQPKQDSGKARTQEPYMAIVDTVTELEQILIPHQDIYRMLSEIASFLPRPR